MKSDSLKPSIVKKSVKDNLYMTKIPTTDLNDGYNELSPNAFKLLTYFYSKWDGWNFVLEDMARALKLSSTRTVQTLMKELQSKGYLYIPKGEIDTYIVGKKEVGKYKRE